MCYIRMFWKKAFGRVAIDRCLPDGPENAKKIIQGFDVLRYNFLTALYLFKKFILGFALSWEEFAVLQRFLGIPSQGLIRVGFNMLPFIWEIHYGNWCLFV